VDRNSAPATASMTANTVVTFGDGQNIATLSDRSH
jgi:hypothetical protein